MSTRKHKSVKVVWRKLGKERAWGQATIGENLIEIDPRLGALYAGTPAPLFNMYGAPGGLSSLRVALTLQTTAST